MKRILLLGILISSYTVHAQKTSVTPFDISINAGVSSPTGNFSKGDYADERSGFANPGFHINISGVYHVNKNFGIGALVGYTQFGFKGSQSLSDGYKEDSGTDSTTLYRKGNNTSLSVLAGPYYSFALGKQFSLDLRLLGGYVNTHLAGFQVFYEDYTDNAMTQKEASAGAFGYQFGAGLKYKVTPAIAIQLQADYFSSKPKIDIAYENFVVNSGRRLTNYNEPISGINTTLGIAFRVGK